MRRHVAASWRYRNVGILDLRVQYYVRNERSNAKLLSRNLRDSSTFERRATKHAELYRTTDCVAVYCSRKLKLHWHR